MNQIQEEMITNNSKTRALKKINMKMKMRFSILQSELKVSSLNVVCALPLRIQCFRIIKLKVQVY